MLGAAAGIPLAGRYLSGGRHLEFFRLLQVSGLVSASCLLVVVVAPTTAVFVLGLLLLSFCGAVLTPGFAVLASLVMPPRARTVGFAITSLWALPGLLVLPIATSVGTHHGLRVGMALAMPMFIVGSLVIGSGGSKFPTDAANAMLASLAALEEQEAREGAGARKTCGDRRDGDGQRREAGRADEQPQLGARK
jgi:MFS family permease